MYHTYMDYLSLVDFFSTLIDIIGIATIVLGSIASLGVFFISWTRQKSLAMPYVSLRSNLGRTIILGLEFLIGGDILRSIAVPASLQNVIVLAVIVVIRTFLSLELQKEIEGIWPWEKRKGAQKV